MKIVAVSACTAGIAHTYMAQEAIEQECKKRGIECKVETQGGMGIENELEQEEIDEADVVIFAVAVGIEMEERFDEKREEGKVIEVDPSYAIKNVSELIDEAGGLSIMPAKNEKKGVKGLGSKLFKYFNTGISYFLPVIIAGGMMFSFALVTGTFEDGTIVPSNQFWQDIYDIGQAGFSMMVPVLSAYIAYAIGSKPALAPGFILGYVANNPIGSQKISTGFLGALILGFLVGYFVKWMKGWKVPQVLKPMMPTFFIPLLTTLVVGVFYVYIMTVPINAFVQLVVSIMNNLNSTSVVLVGLGIGLLAAADFGGPCSKAATAFTLALMSQGLYETNGVFRMCCAIPL